MTERSVPKRFPALVLFLLTLGLLFTLAPGSACALTAYDKLDASPINAAKWDDYEFVRVLDMVDGNAMLHLGIRSAAASPDVVASSLKFTNSSAKTGFGAKIAPLDYQNPYATEIPYAFAGIGGWFYNDGTSGASGDCNGDVFAQVGAGNTESSGNALVLYWSVLRYTASDCSAYELLGGGKLSDSTAAGTGVTIDWNQAGKTFTFTGGGNTATYQAQTAVQDPNTSFKGLFTRISNHSGKDAIIRFHLYDVTVGGSPYALTDGTDHIDAENWTHYEYVRAIKDTDKHLILLTRGTTASTSFTENILPMTSPDNVWTIQATVAAHKLSSSDDLTGHGMVGVGGRFFNDGTVGDSYVGDIGAFVRLQTSPDGLIARWKVTRYADSSNFDQEEISKGTLGVITLDKAYKLSVAWDGTKFTFAGANKTFVYTPPASLLANATAAKGPLKALFSAITDPGIDAVAQGFFTDVNVGTVSQPGFLSVAVNGSGTVTGSPAGISCSNSGGRCSQVFVSGKKVTLNAKPGTGYVFNNWSGECSGTAKTCSITMAGANAAATATFTSNPTITVTPTKKAFNNVKANAKSASAVFTVTNKTTKGAAALNIDQIIVAAPTAEFTITNDGCSNTAVPANKTCKFTAVFTPASVGTNKQATVIIPSNDPSTRLLFVPLTGNGTLK